MATVDDIMRQVRAAGCDAETPSVYAVERNVYRCRCIVCGRCRRHTGNATQGHYWAWCKVTRSLREFHFCCPENCELEAKRG